jgi:hypothetical protein
MQKLQIKRIFYNALTDAKNHKLNMEKWEKTYTKNKKKRIFYNALTDAKITDKRYIL